MGQWFSDNVWLFIIIGVVIVVMAAYLASELYRDKRKRAAAAKAKRQGTPWPTTQSVMAESHMAVGFAEVSGRPVLMVTLGSEQDVQALGMLMRLLRDGVDIVVVKSEFAEAHSIRCVSSGVWAIKSQVEDKWVALRTAEVLLKLRGSTTSI